MDATNRICVDGNEAAARVAYLLSEVISIYPITPASPMGEHCDDWAARGRPNLWGQVPEIVEMQSGAGAAGALHGALQKGAMATTFTASQGLLLMLPNMFKIAGELLATVVHVAARSVATHALSIFGDHSDVMAARPTGWAMLCSSSVQEAQDFALVAHLATLRSRVPFLHFFDGFRTSHEISTIEPLSDDDIGSLVDETSVLELRARGMSPDRPDVRGTAQNPDVFFQGREAANAYYDAVPGIVAQQMDALARRTGRRYGLVEYVGAPGAERVVVAMGSACGAMEELVDAMVADGQRVGLLKLRLYRPFPAALVVGSLPPTTRAIAVLDRCKEAGSVGEPLYLDVRAALDEAMSGLQGSAPFAGPPVVIGGRYGLSSKELTPAMAKAVFEELAMARPKQHFTVGITDDLTRLSLDWDARMDLPRPPGEFQAVFFGLVSDGTVGANKNSTKIVASASGQYAQGYFVYEANKSGAMTVSHLRFAPAPIRSTYLVDRADFVACHQFGLLERADVLGVAKVGGTLLLNCSWGPDGAWAHLSPQVQRQVLAKKLDVWVVDAAKVAAAANLGQRTDTVMQVCFFALSHVVPQDVARREIKAAVAKTYGRRGHAVVERHFAAIGPALAGLARLRLPNQLPAGVKVGLGAHGETEYHLEDADGYRSGAVGSDAAASGPGVDFLRRVTRPLLAGEGEGLPTSALPADGRFPAGTSQLEKRRLASEIPIWDPSICTDCGKCVMVCPHAALRMKVYAPDALAPLGPTPQGFQSKAFRSKNMAGHLLSVQVSPDDCTGCRVCVEVCPAKSKTDHGHRSLTMAPAGASRAAELANWDFFRSIPLIDRSALPHDSVKGAALLEPLFEFSGACAGCGETPYLRLLSQLFGDRLLIANATGCSSTYGGNLPTTPWAVNAEGRGPAWANSLSEDNAEFGLGIRLGLEAQARLARSLLRSLSSKVGARLAADILEAVQDGEGAIVAQRGRVTELKRRLAGLESGGRAQSAARLASLADCLVRKAVWVVGGDDWACDIGFGGLDQVLASGADVNVLVLDGDVYSNTAGHASKSARHGAVARFASSGQPTPKKDLASMARSYGNVYVAQVAIGANDIHTVKAFLEAEAYEGPSLVIAYATCIHDGIDMAHSMAHQKDAVRLGYWSLYRFHPSERAAMERTLVTEPEHSGPEHAGPAHAGPEPRFPTSQPGSDRNRRNKK